MSGLKYNFKHPHTITGNMTDAFFPEETELEAQSQTFKIAAVKMVSVSLECGYFFLRQIIMYTISTFPGIRCQFFSEYLSAKMEIAI